MPYTNSESTPKYIYRIDRRPPEDIFRNGFQSWGSNQDFFRHILGNSLGQEISYDQRSALISASDSPDSALRFFGSMMYNPHESISAYLYEIRADENVYSANRTASNFLSRLQSGTLIFDEGDEQIAREAIDAVFQDFAYQKEWFNVGNIDPSRIRNAFYVDSVQINPDHIRHQADTVYFTPRINEPEILNHNYIDANTRANYLPFENNNDIYTPIRISVPNELVETDASGGISASMGFACALDNSNKLSSNSSNSNDLNNYSHCYIDKNLVRKNLNNNTKNNYFIFSSTYYSSIYFYESNTGKTYSTSIQKTSQNGLTTKLASYNETKQNLQFIYDSYNRIITRENKSKLAYCLSINKTNDVSLYTVDYDIATINDDSQKWFFEKVENKQNLEIYRIKNKAIKNFSLFKKKNDNTNRIYLLNYENQYQDYNEIFLFLDKNKTDSCILMPQKSNNQIIDLQLSWFYKTLYYSPIPETNYSNQHLPFKRKFFYDLNTYKIIYINSYNQIYCLKNNRTDGSWNWIQWINGDLNKTDDLRLKWYFITQKWVNNVYDINFRNIRSFYQNDWLRVMVYGIHWGSFFTSTIDGGVNSIGTFVVSSDVDI